jgi:hypothetical protein
VIASPHQARRHGEEKDGAKVENREGDKKDVPEKGETAQNRCASVEQT